MTVKIILLILACVVILTGIFLAITGIRKRLDQNAPRIVLMKILDMPEKYFLILLGSILMLLGGTGMGFADYFLKGKDELFRGEVVSQTKTDSTNVVETQSCSNEMLDQVRLIGQETWVIKNLATTKYCDGTPIRQATTQSEWRECNDLKIPCWCYYDKDPRNGEKYGLIYNGYAIDSYKSFVPEGWHVAEMDEAKKIKLEYKIPALELFKDGGWINSKSNRECIGNNSTGFSAVPGGYCDANFEFHNVSKGGYWWSCQSDQNNKSLLYAYWLDCDTMMHEPFPRHNGYYIRLIKD